MSDPIPPKNPFPAKRHPRASELEIDVTPAPAIARQLVIDSEGRIRLGREEDGSTPLSEVHQGVFAGVLRHLRDEATVIERLPSSTRFFEVDRVRGWLYTIRTELGDQFDLFAYYDGDAYSVKVVRPELEGKYDAHTVHLFDDGRICFGEDLPTLEAAYAKSVLWANGLSVYARTGAFPF